MQLTAGFLARIGQHPDQIAAMHVLWKNALPVVPTAHDVVHGARDIGNTRNLATSGYGSDGSQP